MKEVNKETGRPLLEKEFDRLTTVRTMVLKSSFIQRVKLKGDTKKGESFQFDSFQIYSSLIPSPAQLSVACSTRGEPGNEASSIVLLFSTLVEHEEVHSKHFIDLHKWTRQVMADNSCSLRGIEL